MRRPPLRWLLSTLSFCFNRDQILSLREESRIPSMIASHQVVGDTHHHLFILTGKRVPFPGTVDPDPVSGTPGNHPASIQRSTPIYPDLAIPSGALACSSGPVNLTQIGALILHPPSVPCTIFRDCTSAPQPLPSPHVLFVRLRTRLPVAPWVSRRLPTPVKTSLSPRLQAPRYAPYANHCNLFLQTSTSHDCYAAEDFCSNGSVSTLLHIHTLDRASLFRSRTFPLDDHPVPSLCPPLTSCRSANFTLFYFIFYFPVSI